MKIVGMFDSFVLKIPIQCNQCYTGAHKDFQTKSLDCLLNVYVEGERTEQYGMRSETPEEYEEKMRELRDEYPDMDDSPLWSLRGMMRRTDNHIPGSGLDDGLYSVYTWCEECQDFFFVDMEVKDGILIGVKR